MAGAGGVFVQQQRAQLGRQNNMIVAQLNQINTRLQAIQDQSKNQDKDTKLQLTAEVGKTKEKYAEAILELRKAVDWLEQVSPFSSRWLAHASNRTLFWKHPPVSTTVSIGSASDCLARRTAISATENARPR